MGLEANVAHVHEDRPVYRTGLHWITISVPLLVSLGAFLIGFLSQNSELSGLAVLWSGFGGLWVASSLLSWITSEFVLSEERILLKSGFLGRRALDIGIAKVQGITVKQGMLGRWLGFGTLTVRRDGGREDRFSHIASVLQLGTHIAEALGNRDVAQRRREG
ncbi:MAG: PH domain-containing protein [Desulfomonile tiedjei]|nr:PH domain-containing protein [Desulfomonile tiedjei]